MPSGGELVQGMGVKKNFHPESGAQCQDFTRSMTTAVLPDL